MSFPCLLQPYSGYFSTQPRKELQHVCLHSIIFYWPGELPNMTVPQSFPEGHQWLPRFSTQSTFTLLDLWVAFRTADSSFLWNALFFWLQEPYKLLVFFLLIWLLFCCLISLYSALKNQSSSTSSARVLTSLFHSSPRQWCSWFQLQSVWLPDLYI